MTRWGKAFRIVKMEWKFPGQMIILMIMAKVTPKSEKKPYKNQVELDFGGMWKTALRKVPNPL